MKAIPVSTFCQFIWFMSMPVINNVEFNFRPLGHQLRISLFCRWVFLTILSHINLVLVPVSTVRKDFCDVASTLQAFKKWYCAKSRGTFCLVTFSLDIDILPRILNIPECRSLFDHLILILWPIVETGYQDYSLNAMPR